ncbi:transposase [Clostridia bacterium]|nr:transposase [Clostridia bacterium]
MADKILLPRSDFIFKLIFGDQRNVDILAAFLKTVLDLPESEYDKITVVDPHLKREADDDKAGILDVKIHTKSGKVVDVEIQVQPYPSMQKRTVFYVSKMVLEQIGKGKSYDDIQKVISLIITDYIFIEENDVYHNQYYLYDKKTGSQFTDIVEVDTLELPKLPKQEDGTELWDWMQFLNARQEEEFTMLAERNPQIKKAVGVLMELSADERTRLLYDEREKWRMDEMDLMQGAEKKGRSEGRYEERIGIAKNLIKNKIPIDVIANSTGLLHEEIEALRKEV